VPWSPAGVRHHPIPISWGPYRHFSFLGGRQMTIFLLTSGCLMSLGFGIESYIGGEAIKTFIVNVWPGYADLGGSFNLLGINLSSLITLLFFWSLNLLLLFKGMGVIRIFENIAAPLGMLLTCCHCSGQNNGPKL
jgi:cytosine/uracil/thiamine/allantoin permease